MKYTVALVLVTISMVHGSIVGGIGALVGPAALRGPSSGATIVGPDGSIISSGVDGGALLATSGLGGIALGNGAGLIAAPAWGARSIGLGGLGAVIQGPSGIISTNGNPLGAVGIPGVGIVRSVEALGLGLGQEVWRR